MAEDRRRGGNLTKRRLNDTGLRKKISTGALRERAPGKGRFDAVSPIALERLALHMELADIKYKKGGGCRNWEKGMPLSFYEDGMRRHLNQWRLGDNSEDHLAAVLWNVMCLIHTQEMIEAGLLPQELADIPFYGIASKTIKSR
jgi:hypothetical protein